MEETNGASTGATPIPSASNPTPQARVAAGRFGAYGGRYVPETLMAALQELEAAYAAARKDKSFRDEFHRLLTDFAGRPTPLFFAERLTKELGGAKIYLKREDLLHTGAHKINNCIGQALLARRMGKHRIIAETGAGQHGVATATVCALFGMECVVYMGTEDMRRQELNVFRMRLLGAEVRGVESGSRTLKDAINEAMRDWVTNVRTTHYLLGSVLGAHPYPTMVRDFHRVIGQEARKQILKAEGRLPTRDHRLRRRRIERHRRVLRVHQGRGCEADRRRSRRPRPRAGRARGALRRRRSRAFCRARIPMCCRTRRADRADALGFGRPGLSRDRSRACRAARSGPRGIRLSHRSGGAGRLPHAGAHWKALFLRWSRRTRSPNVSSARRRCRRATS